MSTRDDIAPMARFIARIGTLGRREAVEAVWALAEAERASEGRDDERAYRRWWGSDEAARHRGTIRRYGEQLGDASLEEMQAALCDLLEGSPFAGDRFAVSVRPEPRERRVGRDRTVADVSGRGAASARERADCADCRATDHCLRLGEPCPTGERLVPERWPVCGGLSPGDRSHTRCC